MLFIQAKDISFHYESFPENFLENINFDIYQGDKVGLIGKNGCGKSTLFGLIAGMLSPVSGTIYRKENIQAGVLEQEIYATEGLTLEDYLWAANPLLLSLRKKLTAYETGSFIMSEEELINTIAAFDSAGGYLFEAETEKIVLEFGFEPESLKQPVIKFSGGEKTKAALASVLLKKPDILFLDEPTNHLDSEYLLWLENYLQSVKIPYIVISHDRAFLDNCTKEIWEIDNKTLKRYSGNYSFYKQQKEIELENQIIAYQQSRKKVKQLEEAYRQRRNKADSFENFKEMRSVKKNGGICKRDEGSGSARLSVGKMMKSAVATETRIGKLLEKEIENKPFIEKKRTLQISNSSLKNRWVLEAENIGKQFGSSYLFRNLFLCIKNGSRVLLAGSNGSGKSTLIKILTGIIQDFEGSFKWAPQAKIGYYAQEYEILNPEHSVIEEIIKDNSQQTRARTILGSLNIRGDKVYHKISSLSPGEKSKVSLAKLLLGDFDVLILDEPTNHLEISAREAFEQALENYDGTIIFVSHDRYLVEKLVEETVYL